jgi:Xaa-Pro aminopeptidase
LYIYSVAGKKIKIYTIISIGAAPVSSKNRIKTEESKSRLRNLRNTMDENGIHVAIIQFFVDIYYFSGVNQLSTLIVPLNRDPVLFVQVGLDMAKEESWIDDIRELKGMASLETYFKEQGIGIGTIGINEDTVPATLYRKYRETLPQANFNNISPHLLKIRSIKSDTEIELIKKAADVSYSGHQRIVEVIQEGMTELELSASVEYTTRQQGHAGCSIGRRNAYYPPAGVIGVSGPNLGIISGSGAITISGKGLSAALPMGASSRPIEYGDMVAADISTNIDGYHSDETRMYVLGEPDDHQKRAFDVIYAAQQAALDAIRPGVKGRDVYHAARQVVEKAGYLEHFAGYSRYPQYNYLGHGVGLEANEHPLINSRDDTILQPNMVIAVEPKLIAPQWGVSLEDTLLITNNGYKLLTKTKRKLVVV